MKKYLSLVLALIMLTSMLPVSTSAATVKEALPAITNVVYAGTNYNIKSPMTADGTLSRYCDINETFNAFNGISFGENSYYIQPAKADYQYETYRAATSDWLSFEVNRTADIYVITAVAATYMKWLSTAGFVQVDGATVVNNSESGLARRKNSNVWKLTTATLPVDGSSKQTITLKGCSGGLDETWGVYSVIIDFKKETTQSKGAPTLSNVVYMGSDYDIKSPMTVDGSLSRYKDKSDETFTSFENITFGENSYYIQPSYADNANAKYKDKNAEWLSFEINRTADIYVLAAAGPCSSWLNWLLTGYEKQTDALIKNTSAATQTGRIQTSVYKLSSKVLPVDGSETQKFVFNGCGDIGSTHYFYGVYGVVIDFKGDAELSRDTPRISNVDYKGSGYSIQYPVKADGSLSRYYDLPEEVFISFSGIEFGENSFYIQPSYADYSNAAYKDGTADWLSFEINRTAEIYIVTPVTPSTSYLPSIHKLNPVKLDDTLTNDSTASNARRKTANLYKISSEILPVDGSKTQKFDFKGCGNITNMDYTYGVYGVIVDFKEPPELPVKNIKYNGADKTAIAGFSADGTLARFSDKASFVFNNFKGYEFANESYYIQPVYADATKENYTNSEAEWITFDLAKTANVYVVTNVNVTNTWLPWLDSDGFKAVSEDGEGFVNPRTTTGKLKIENAGGASAAYTKAILYKKTYIVSDGETLNVSLKGCGDTTGITNYGTYGVVVEFPQEELTVPEALEQAKVFSSANEGTLIYEDKIYQTYFIASAVTPIGYNKIPREKFGLLLSKELNTEETLVLGAEGVTRINAYETNADGEYAYLFHGFDCSASYYVRPYAYYGGKLIYGSIIRSDER